MPAETIEAPKQVLQEPKSDGFLTRMAEARAKAQAAEAPAPKVEPKVEPKIEPKVEPKKPDLSTEPKVEPSKLEEPPKKDNSLAEAITKIKSGEIEPKKEPVKEDKPDLSKMTKEQKEAWTYKQLREKADQADTLRKELEDMKGKLNGTDIEALKKELDDIKKVAEERQKALAAVDITQSEKYQNEVAQPLTRILKELHDTAKDFGYSWPDFVNAVEQPTKREREQAMSKVLAGAEKEISPLTQLDILSSVNEYLQRQQFGEALIQNSIPAKEAMEREKAESAQRQKKESEMEFDRVSGMVFDHLVADDLLKDTMPFLLDEHQKLDEAKAKQIRQAASFTDSPAHIRALNAYSTELLPMALEDNRSLRAKLKEYEERIGELTNTSPSIKSKGGEVTSGDDPDKGLTLEQRIAKIRMGQKGQ